MAEAVEEEVVIDQLIIDSDDKEIEIDRLVIDSKDAHKEEVIIQVKKTKQGGDDHPKLTTKWDSIGGGGYAYYLGFQGDIFALLNGSALWKYKRGTGIWNDLQVSVKTIGVTTTKPYYIATSSRAIYEGTPNADGWTKIRTISTRDPYIAVSFISGGNTIYYMDSNNRVWSYDGTPEYWTRVDTANITQYVAANDTLAALDNSVNKIVYQFDATAGTWTQVGSGYSYLVGATNGDFFGVTSTNGICYFNTTDGTTTTISTPFQNVSPYFVCDSIGFYAIVLSGDQQGTWNCLEDGTPIPWMLLSTGQPNTSSTMKVYNNSGAAAYQPIMADSSSCWVYLSSQGDDKKNALTK